MHFKRLISIALLLSNLFFFQKAVATHVMGGEITWDCQANGQYVFTLKIYRDCNGINFNANNHEIEVHNYPTIGTISTIPLNFLSVDDITAACEGSPCATLSPSDPNIPGAIEEYVLQSNPITLNGVPPAAGWIFTWTYGGRNAAIDNIVNAQSFDITLRAKMYAYNGQNANNCFDSSPNFFQKPSTIICAGEEFTYNHSAFDSELDSLSYEWGRPLDGNFCNPPPCFIGGLYVENTNPGIINLDAGSGFRFDSPFPDTNLDARNVPAQLDPETGEITFTSFNQGEYISVIKVTAWRCGQRIAEVYRELQTVITAGCAPNLPPEVVTSFSSNILRDTVKVGDFVDFNISIIDSLRTGNPKDDSLYIFASGLMFGNNFTDSTSGCPSPPCATLSRATPDTGFSVYNTRFRWRTNCDQIANYTPVCNVNQNTYLFTIRAFDDYCPAAGQTITSIAITILGDSLVVNPEIYCADVLSDGAVSLSWQQSPDPDSAFHQWMIYSANNRAGPYTLIDSVLDYTTTNYTDTTASADQQSKHYVIRAKSGCNEGWTLLEADTISSIFQQISFNNDCVDLNWNRLSNPNPNGSDTAYRIYREYPIGSGFSLYASSSDERFCDTFNVCTDTVTYRIELVNVAQSCASNSNLAGIRFAYPDPDIDAGNDLSICDGQSAILGGSPSSTVEVSYQWSPATNLNDDTLPNPIANPSDTLSYFLTVTDEKGCTAVDSITVNSRERPVPDAGVDSNVCIESFPLQLYGNVSVSNSGRWIGGNGTFDPNRNSLNALYDPSAEEIDSGFVELALISENIGICDPDTDQIRITIVRFTGNPIATLSNVSCFGEADGAINLNPGGGFTPYLYSWSDGPSSQNRSNLSAGSYTVTMTNAFGCDSVLSFTVSEPNLLSSSISSSTNVSCNGLSDGSATINVNGGTTPYAYQWNDPSSSTAATVNNLSAGNYQVTVTDNNGCTLVDSSTLITEPATLLATANLVQNVSCFSGADGSALASVSGGTPPYSYLWDDPSNTANATLNGLAAGLYRLSVTDANGCIDSASITITEPTALTASISPANDISCNGASDGSATMSVSGGTPPYIYLWNDAANSTTASISNLNAGTYSVTATDNLGCTISRSITINEPAQLTTALSNQINVSCNGFDDGEAFVGVSGGTTPYSFQWNDPSNTTNDTVSNLFAGTYTVTVTDSNLCTITQAVIITEPNELLLEIEDSNQVSCFGLSDGSARATISGGTNPYNIQWNDPGNTTTDSVSGLFAGTYVIRVTDAQSCSAQDSVIIDQADSLEVTVNVTRNLSCFNAGDGSAFLQILGGNSPYTIQWDDPSNSNNDSLFNLSAGKYQVTVTDQNSCSDTSSVIITEPQALSLSVQLIDSVSCFGLSDASAFALVNGGTAPYTFQWDDPSASTGDSIFNLSSGAYRLSLMDANGCLAVDSITIGEPDSLNLSLDQLIDVSCFGGNDGIIRTSTIGGTAPYSYQWSNNDQTDSLNGVPAGSYQLTVTDANQCTDTLSVIISEPQLLSSSIDSSVNVSCSGLTDGFANVNVSGGVNPYSFQWDDPTNSTTSQISNLSSRRYTVTVTDANQCTSTSSIFISQPAPLASASTTSVDVSCFGFADGSASISVLGGTSPYTYSWSNASDSSSAVGLDTGQYFVTITDSNGCSLIDSVIINQPSPLDLALDADSINCNGFNDGQIISQVSGGISPYTFDWSNNQTAQNVVNLQVGLYLLTVTDDNGCTSVDSARIDQPDSIVVNLTDNDTICVNSPILLQASASGGVGSLRYSWNEGLPATANQSVSPTQTTLYRISVTDQNNCPASQDSVLISVRNIFNESVTLEAPEVICEGESATLIPQFNPSPNAIGPFVYIWNQGLSGTDSVQVSPSTTTFYQLQIVDACTNSIVDTTRVRVSEPPTISLNDSLIEGCSPLSVQFSSESPAGYSHHWDFGNGNTSSLPNPSQSFVNSGNLVQARYFVNYRLQNLDGCESEFDGDFEIRVNPTPLASFTLSKEFTDIDNPTVQAFGNVSNAQSFFWTFGDGDSALVAEPVHTYQDTGNYTITFIKENSFGCRDTSLRTFRVEPSFEIRIPNVFTPSSGGSNGGNYDPNNPDNTVFFPFVEYAEEYRLSIFNRWGELIFESKDQNVGWDGYYRGELCQSDVYVYKLEVRFINGQRTTKVGDVTLLR